MGISHDGDTLEQYVLDSLPGSIKGPKRNQYDENGVLIERKCDIIWWVGDKKISIECKKAQGDTINQIRPSDYLTHVILTPDNTCLVIPPNRLIRDCHTKRGQHTPLALSCYNSNASRWRECLANDLTKAITEAYDEGESDIEAKMCAQSWSLMIETLYKYYTQNNINNITSKCKEIISLNEQTKSS